MVLLQGIHARDSRKDALSAAGKAGELVRCNAARGYFQLRLRKTPVNFYRDPHGGRTERTERLWIGSMVVNNCKPAHN